MRIGQRVPWQSRSLCLIVEERGNQDESKEMGGMSTMKMRGSSIALCGNGQEKGTTAFVKGKEGGSFLRPEFIPKKEVCC